MKTNDFCEREWVSLERFEAAEARVKGLEEELRLRPTWAEARVKELEARSSYCGGNPACGRRMELETRIKELEAERDDLLRLGSNHR